jgi:LL-diaminopimelate aminotransferase
MMERGDMRSEDAARPGWNEPQRLRSLPPYPLADVPDIKARLLAEGSPVIDLGVGDPGLPVPDAAVPALCEAAADPALHKYGFQRGLPAFRAAVAEWMQVRFSRPVDPESEVLPVIGSKEAIALAAFALLDPDDSVLIPDPGYAPYFGGSFFAGARVISVPLRADEGFLVPPEAIRSARGRLRIVYLNYPNNPTSAVADPEYLRQVVTACRERDAVLLFDNAYSEITYDGFRAPGLLEVDGGREAGIEFHSFSKTYNMTGWRLGWAVGDARRIAALRRVKTFFDTGGFMAVQAAGAAVLRDAAAYIRWNVGQLCERRDAAVRAFQSVGLEVSSPRGTLYLWFPVPTGEPSEQFCRRLLLESGVVLLPGSAMGAGGEGFVRASLAVPPDQYERAGRRIREAV